MSSSDQVTSILRPRRVATYSLPVEILEHILRHASGPVIARCLTVSKHFNTLIQTSKYLQHQVQSYLAGVVDGPMHCRKSITERLELATQWRDAWDNARFSQSNHLKLPSPVRVFKTEFSGFTLCHKFENDGHSVFNFAVVPSKLREVPEKQWQFSLEESIEDWAYCDTQDLIVGVERLDDTGKRAHVHLLSASTGSPHPHARINPLEYESPGDIPIGYGPFKRTTIHLATNILIVTVSHYGEDDECPHSFAWDWRTGQQLLHIHGAQLHSIAVLDHQHVMLPIQSGDTSQWALAVLNCYTVPSGCLTTEDVHKYAITILGLPRPVPRVESVRIFLSVNTSVDAGLVGVHPNLSLPLYPASGHQIVFLEMVLDDYYTVIAEHRLVIPPRAIFPRLQAYKPGECALPIPWRTWGHETRYFPDTPDLAVLSGPSSSRLLVTENARNDEWTLVIYDFGASAFSQQPATPTPHSSGSHVVVEPSAIESKWYTSDDAEVQTTAPYRRIPTDIKVDAFEMYSRYNTFIGEHSVGLVWKDWPSLDYHSL